MKKLLVAVVVTMSLVGCSNWNRVTPSGMDNAAMTAEVKKNLLGDNIKGIDVDTTDGVVTLTGHIGTRADRGNAVHDARKVSGVRRVIDHIEVP